MMKRRWNKVFLLLLFAIGLLATFSYGAYLDQSSEQDILFYNLKEYLIHIPGESDLEQELNAADVIAISDSVERDHGVAVYYPIALSMWRLNVGNPRAGNVLWHLYTYIFFFLAGCRPLYYFTKDVFKSERTAAFVVSIFFFTPRIFAECHYNNKDIILLALFAGCIRNGWRLMHECSTKNVIFFSVAGAFAFNVKIVGAWYWGLIGIYVLLYYVFTKQFTRNVFAKMCLCILSWIAIYIFITPACWADIVAFFQYIFLYAVNFNRWTSYILYQGKMIHTEYTGIPHKYLLTMIFLTIPVGIMVMIFAGGVWLAVHLFKTRGKCFLSMEGYLFVIALCGAVPLMYAMIAQTPVYNGWRHFYFSYVAMIICAGYCVYQLEQRVTGTVLQKAMHGGEAVYVALLLLSIGMNHPQEHSYYNLLAGSRVEQNYELDYWELSVSQAFDIIQENLTEMESTTVSALNTTTMWGLEGNWEILPQDFKDRVTLTPEWETASYVIVNTTYANMYSMEEYSELKREYVMIDEISSYGNIVCEVYRRK